MNYAPVQTSASYAAERNEAARRLADAERQAARRYEDRQAVNDQRVGHAAAARPMVGGSFYPQQPQPTRPQLPVPSTIPIKFRSSPFYRIDKALSSATECVRAGQGDRKTVTLGFALTQAQQALLTAS